MADKGTEIRPAAQTGEQKGLVTDVVVPLVQSGLSGYVGAKVAQGTKKDK